MQAQYRVEGVERALHVLQDGRLRFLRRQLSDPSGKALVQAEDLAVGAAHRRERIVAAEQGGERGIKLVVVLALVRKQAFAQQVVDLVQGLLPLRALQRGQALNIRMDVRKMKKGRNAGFDP